VYKLRESTEDDFRFYFSWFKQNIIDLAKNNDLSWRGRINKSKCFKDRSKLTYYCLAGCLDFTVLNCVALDINDTYFGCVGFDPHAHNVVMHVLFPELIILILMLLYDLTYEKVENYLKFLGKYGS